MDERPPPLFSPRARRITAVVVAAIIVFLAGSIAGAFVGWRAREAEIDTSPRYADVVGRVTEVADDHVCVDYRSDDGSVTPAGNTFGLPGPSDMTTCGRVVSEPRLEVGTAVSGVLIPYERGDLYVGAVWARLEPR